MRSIKFYWHWLLMVHYLFLGQLAAQDCTISFDGEEVVCLEAMEAYEATIPTGLTAVWTIDGTPQNGNNAELVVDWSQLGAGEFEVCLGTEEECDGNLLTPFCETITVLAKNEVDSIAVFCTGLFIEILNQETGRRDTAFSTTDIHTWTYTSAAGCDSIVNYNLTILDTETIEFSDTSICPTDYLYMGIDSFNTNGRHCGRVLDEEGCIVFHCRRLQIRDSIKTFIAPTICAEDAPYELWNQSFSQSEIITNVFQAADGCDSTVTVDLTILESLRSTRFDTICADEIFTIGDTTFNRSGIYQYTYQSALGCDSVVTINLLARQPIETFTREEICAGDSLNQDGNIWFLTGDYEYTLPSINGCDSTVFVSLSVLAPNETILDTIICYGEQIGVLSSLFGESGLYQTLGTASDGCDSLVILNLEVEDQNVFEFEQTLCFGDPCVVIGDSLLCETGHYELTLATDSGCDSIVIADIIAKEELVTEFGQTICPGDFSDKIRDTVFYESGVHQVLLESVDGCDSLVILYLTIDEDEGALNNNDIEVVEICQGTSITFGNNTYSNGGVFSIRLTGSSGCDSTISIAVIVKDTVHLNLEQLVCIGDSVQVGSNFYSQEGQFTETIVSSVDCDSVINLTVVLMDCNIEIEEQIDSTECDGNNGKIAFKITEGIPAFTFEWSSQKEGFMGEGEIDSLEKEIVFDSLDGGLYTLIIRDTLTGFKQFDLEVPQPVEFDHDWEFPEYNGYNLACTGDQDGFLEIIVNGGTPPYQYEWSNGGISAGQTDLPAGTYAVTVTDAMGCDFVESFALEEPLPLTIDLDVIRPNCEDLMAGNISVMNIEGGATPYEFQLKGESTFSPRMSYQELEPGDYTLAARDANGCQTEVEINLPLPAIPNLNFERELYIDLGEAVEINLDATIPIARASWEGPAGLNCYNCTTPIASPLETQTYTVTAISVDSCVATEQLVIFVDKERDLYVPNIFSPNGDGINDRLVIYGGPEVASILTFQVYARWGGLVYDQQNLSPNDETGAWDGTFAGKTLRPGVFIWKATVSFIDGVEKEYYGDVVIK